MRLKDDTVKPEFTPGMMFGVLVARDVYTKYGYNFVITSGKDGEHSRNSLHYSGNAVDLRVWGVKDIGALVVALKQRLNIHYDIVNEGDHIHIEYDPKY